MNDPERLLRGKQSPLAGELLRSLKRDSPPPAALKRALGVAITTSATLGATGSAAAKSLLVSAAKWALCGALAGGGVAGGVALVNARLAPPTPIPVRAVAPSVRTHLQSSRLADRTKPVPDEPIVEIDDLASSPSRARAASSQKVETATADRASELREQRLAIQDAQAALAAGRADDTLARLDDYARRFPHPIFDQEAVVLRIQALLAKGDRSRAETVAQPFLTTHPDSPFARRVRSLVYGEQPPR